MLIKKLRTQRMWSQEQLAVLAGISPRTVQRIEAGNSASIETLKALASVFEIDIEKLTKETIVIDKTTEQWQEVAKWASLGLWGIKTRKTALIYEKGCAALGLLGFLLGVVYEGFLPFTVFLGSAYWYAVSIRHVDNKGIW